MCTRWTRRFGTPRALQLNGVIARSAPCQTCESVSGAMRFEQKRRSSSMSVTLLVLFAIAMLAAVIGKFTVAAAGVANVTCLCMLVLFVALTRIHGVRKPVV